MGVGGVEVGVGELDADLHAAWSLLSWFWARSSTFLAWSSWRLALSIAVWSADCTASAWSSVRRRISLAWSRVSCEPPTTGDEVILSSAARSESSCDWAWASVWRAENGSTVAKISPGVTVSPTFTLTAVSWPPLTNPRFCSVADASDPVAETPLVIDVRWTTAVRGCGGVLLVVQATTPLATSAMATPARAVRRSASLCHRPVARLGARCLDIRTLLPVVGLWWEPSNHPAPMMRSDRSRWRRDAERNR